MKQGLPFLGTFLLLLLVPWRCKADFVLVLLGFAGVLQEKDCGARWERGRSTRKLLFEHPSLKIAKGKTGQVILEVPSNLLFFVKDRGVVASVNACCSPETP